MTTEGNRDSVLIAGGGIIGIACAEYLSQAGFQVTVIDQGAMARGCSHGNCGYIAPSHILPLTVPGAIGMAIKSLFNPDAPFRVKPRVSPSLWKWLLQFARRCTHRQMLAAGVHLQSILQSSMSEYRQLVSDGVVDGEWKEQGLLFVLQTPKGMQAFARTDALLTEHFGLPARRLEGDDLSTFEPALREGLAGAFWYEDDTNVRPDKLSESWVSGLRSRGVQFIEQCRLEDITRTANQITGLVTSQGNMQAEHYVFALGAWSPLFEARLGCRIPIEPGKGYSVTMARPQTCPVHPILFPEHKVGVTPFDSGYRLGSMMEFAGYDASVSDRRINQLRQSARSYLIEPFTDETYETWYGWRPMTWDSLPVIGRVPRLENALLATGHNMLGLSLAAATGRLISEMIQEQPTHIDATAFSPDRFQS